MKPLELALLLAQRRGWSQTDLADRISSAARPVTKQMMSNWKARGLPAAWHAPIARALGITVEDLLAEDHAKINFHPDDLSRVEKRRQIPMLTLADCPPPLDFQASEFIEPVFSSPGPRAFALRVHGDSMMSPTGAAPTFPDGAVLVVDPDRQPVAGDFVIAREPHSGRQVFKRLASDGAQWMLRSLNPAYPSYEFPSIDGVIGVVTESFIGQRF